MNRACAARGLLAIAELPRAQLAIPRLMADANLA
jgi:hypothetical protein